MTTCPACGADGDWTHPFHARDGVPVNSCLLVDTAEQAEGFPTGVLRLAVCRSCGFLMNTAFDPAMTEYSSRYEETQGYSARFNDFARALAKRWVDDYGLHGKHVLEIGCGKGEFLAMMVEAGAGSGTGIDPSVHPDRIDDALSDRLTWIADFYRPEYGEIAADAIVCRHTLEHIAPVADFLREIRASIGDRTDITVLFELPDVERVLAEGAFWDVYYEHCSYFTLDTLVTTFARCGFTVLAADKAFDDQYLLIEAVPDTAAAEGIEIPVDRIVTTATVELADAYAIGYERRVAALRNEAETTDGPVVAWGGGSKGVTYVEVVGAERIDAVVDINPHKHGKFLPGTGLEVVGPESLIDTQPEMVVVMNPVYVEEISGQLADLGLHPKVVAL